MTNFENRLKTKSARTIQAAEMLIRAIDNGDLDTAAEWASEINAAVSQMADWKWRQQERAKKPLTWICDDGGCHWSTDQCDCEPEGDNE